MTAVNDCERETKITSDPYEIAVNVWRPSAADATWSSLAWLKNGAGNRAKLRSKVAFADADASTLAGLKSIKAVFDQKPTCAVYPLADALGLTDEAVAALACTVVDAAGEDYSEIVTPAIVDGKLVLKNARPSGLTLILR